MLAKNNRVNTDFQILHFLIGACQTPDGAYALLCELYDERNEAVQCIEAMRLKLSVEKIQAERLSEDEDDLERMLGTAKLIELEATKANFDKNVAAAKEELEFIQLCKDRLQPYRKYAHLPDAEAHKMCHREEWRLELISRAENSLMTSGTIPIDEFKTMRMHPDFETIIFPEISNIKRNIEEGNIQKILFKPKNIPLELLEKELLLPNTEKIKELKQQL